jgi:hypothetical protein
LPDLKSFSELLTAGASRQPMTTQAEVLRDGTIGRQEALRVAGRFEPLHPLLSLPSGLVRVLGAIVEIPMLAMFHSRENLSLSGSVAFQLVGDDDPWDVGQPFEQLAQELLRGAFIPPTLDQDIEHVPVLINRSPQVVALALDGQKYFIKMPLISRARAATPELIGVLLAKLATPLADRFIRHDDSAFQEHFLHVAETQTEAKVQPHRVANNLDRKPVILIFRSNKRCIHAVTLTYKLGVKQVVNANKLSTPASDTQKAPKRSGP